MAVAHLERTVMTMTESLSSDTDREQLTETTGNPHIESGPREAVNHPGIDGTWHHYGALEWWDPENLYGDDYARPICPVSECATGEAHECRTICERIDVDRGIRDKFIDVAGKVGGGWYCGLHGWFRVFDYPREDESDTTQQTLIADGGTVEDDIDREAYGGAVNSDVSYFRDSGRSIDYPVIRGVTCHKCGSVEVWQPMQTMDMPMMYRCLGCGETAPTDDFDRYVDTDIEGGEFDAE